MMVKKPKKIFVMFKLSLRKDICKIIYANEKIPPIKSRVMLTIDHPNVDLRS